MTKAAETFKWFSPLIPWIALVLLLFIGGGLLKDGIEELRAAKSDEVAETAADGGTKLSFATLMMQGVATSIDALSVGFTTAAYNRTQALISSLIIGVPAGFHTGGLILIGIGIEIWVKGVFF